MNMSTLKLHFKKLSALDIKYIWYPRGRGLESQMTAQMKMILIMEGSLEEVWQLH